MNLKSDNKEDIKKKIQEQDKAKLEFKENLLTLCNDMD